MATLGTALMGALGHSDEEKMFRPWSVCGLRFRIFCPSIQQCHVNDKVGIVKGVRQVVLKFTLKVNTHKKYSYVDEIEVPYTELLISAFNGPLAE